MDLIKDKSIMCKILDIEPTNNTEELILAFMLQYGELAFTTKEREKELVEQFTKKARKVLLQIQKEQQDNKHTSEV